MSWKTRYPQGRGRALTFSYDDGQIFDRRLVEIFDRYGMKAAFHLNSANLGRDGFVAAGEIPALYARHEVACHGREHLYFTHLSPAQLVSELWEDRRALETASGRIVTGLSYPFGVCSSEAADTARALGTEYSRTVEATGNFRLPEDFLFWHPTCHHGDSRLKQLAERFLDPPAYADLELFYVWGHSFEFSREDNWDLIESFCARLAGRDDIWYATNLEICRYVRAARALVSSADGALVHNPSGVTVWIAPEGGEAVAVAPGETVRVG